MEYDWRTPTEHVQCTSTKITSVFDRFTRQTFSFPDKLSLVPSFLHDASPPHISLPDIILSGVFLFSFFLPALCKAPHCGLRTSGPLPPTTHHVVINPIRILGAKQGCRRAAELLCSSGLLSSEQQQQILASVTSAFASYLQAKHFPGAKGKIVGNSEQVKPTVGSRVKYLIFLSNPKHPSQILRVRGSSSAHFIDSCNSVSVVEGELL